MLGKVFALCTDEEQAQFLNEAGKTLDRVTRGMSGAEGYDMQCCRIADKLDAHGVALIKRLAAFIASDEGR